MTSAVIRNKCFNNRLKRTPYYITERKPNLSKMHIFRSICSAYKNLTKKLDPKCEKGMFVGYDRNSPSYLVFYPGNKRVLKHRVVKFITKMTNQLIQTYPTNNDEEEEDDFFQKKNRQNRNQF